MKSQVRIGHPLIDAQHDELHKVIKRLSQLLDTGGADEEISEQVDRLSRHVRMHFDSEEAIMREYSIPQEMLELHVLEHNRILGDMIALYEREMHGLKPQPAQLCAMVENWVNRHLEEYDRQLTVFFRNGSNDRQASRSLKGKLGTSG